MRIIKISFFISTVILGNLNAQSLLFDETPTDKRIVEADMGKDIRAPGGTTIILDASGSAPSDILVSYEWSFPPNMIFQDDYNFNATDKVISYEREQGTRASLKRIITRNKYIELDLPNDIIGTKYTVFLKVEDYRQRNDEDTLLVTIIKSVDEFLDDSFSFIPIEESLDTAKNKTNETLISIQPINRNALKQMEVETINAIIYNEIIKLGITEVLNPNRFIPESIKTEKLVKRTRFESDTLINYQENTTDTLITLDTLTYNEIIDSVLYYNFDCRNDSCAADNAVLENAGQVLSWGINKYSELELHFFVASQHLNTSPTWNWEASIVSLDPEASEKLRYPEALAVPGNGSLLIAAGNKQTVYELKRSQQSFSVTTNPVLDDTLFHPSGIDVGLGGLIYITDRDNHRLFSKSGENYELLLSPEKNRLLILFENSTDGSLKKENLRYPTKVRVGSNGDVYVLYEGNDCVLKLSPYDEVSAVLKAGIVKGVRDIAINSKDSLFVVSPDKNMVYRVINDSTVIPFAGMEKTDGMIRNDIKATKAFLESPTAIDFDDTDQLYVADEKLGLIRKVDPNGVITTPAGISNRIYGISGMRVSRGPNPQVFLTQSLKHQIQRIELDGSFPWRKETKINSPRYVIEKDGVYGLEPDLRTAVSNVLYDQVPEKKKGFIMRAKEGNKRIGAYVKKHPIFFALVLVFINQAISASIDSDGGSKDAPPSFPF